MTERNSVGRTCTCGIGPWSVRGVCEECGGIDLGIPTVWFDPLEGAGWDARAEHAPARTFRPNQKVTLTGSIVGSSIVTGEYVVLIDGSKPADPIRVHGTHLHEPSPDDGQLTVCGTLAQVASQLRDWQARLPALIRDVDDALGR